MSKRKTHLGAAKKHGRRAVAELRHMAADSALHWVLSHKDRVAQFRRSVKGTRAAASVDRLLAVIHAEASTLPRAPRKRKPVRVHRRRVARTWAPRNFMAAPF